MNLGCLILLLYPAIADLRYRKFYIEPVIGTGVLVTVFRLAGDSYSLFSVGLGCLPGIFLWGVSKLTKGAVGFGDVIVVTCLGMIAGWEYVSTVCLLALWMAGLLGLVMLIMGRAGRKTALPFVPFLLAACLMLQIGDR